MVTLTKEKGQQSGSIMRIKGSHGESKGNLGLQKGGIKMQNVTHIESEKEIGEEGELQMAWMYLKSRMLQEAEADN